MSDPDQRSAIARIVAAHRGAGKDHAALAAALSNGLTRAIRRAAMPFATLTPEVAEVTATADTALSDAVAAMPAHGLTAAIEDEEGRRGLFILEHPLVDALIEVQATGAVEEGELPPRKITRIDEALCRDFVDLMLGAFAQETAQAPGRDWPDRMRYGSNIGDRVQLNLLMPERNYTMLRTKVTMGGRKSGALILVLPSDPSLARSRALSSPKDEAPVDWSKQMLSVLGEAPMTLDAVLMRVTMPLGQVEALSEGDLVPFDHRDLSAVTLENESGHVFARGSLGQLSGRRAMRFGGPPVAAQGGTFTSTSVPGSEMAMMPVPDPLQMDLSPAGALPGGPAMAAAPLAASPEPAAPMGGFDPDAPMGDFDPNAPMGGFDPDAPMGDFDPNAPMGDFDPNAPMGDFDPNAPMG